MISRDSIKTALKSAPPPIRAVMRFLTVRPLRTYIRFAPWYIGKSLLYDSVADHLWWLEATVTGSTVFGGELEVDARDIIGKHIYYFGIWEPNLTHWIERRLRPGDLFIDVGANVGYYSLLASKLVGDSGKVVAVEALPQIFSRLEHNLRQNGAKNVRAVNAAAWDKPEKVRIFTREEALSGATTLMFEWANRWQLKQQLEIDARPLSVILTPAEIKAARLMKIDVEGAEWHIISEMTSWLAHTEADLEIMIEISRSMMEVQRKGLQDILRLFAMFGFHGYRIQNDYRASACIERNTPSAPQRIKRWPDEPVDQIDLIFSRVDAEYL